MTIALICTTARTIAITPLSGATPGTASYTQTVTSKVKVSGSGVLLDKIEWTVTGCSSAAYTGGTASPKSMSATNSKVLCSGKKIMRLGDSGTCTGVLVSGNNSIPCSCKHEIVSAGQNKVSAS